MSIRVGINGFGRIGRNVLRASLGDPELEFVAVNDITDSRTLAHLLKYDSVLGNLPNEVSHDEQNVILDGRKIRVFSEKDPAAIQWASMGVEFVIEATGKFTKAADARKHIKGPVKKVIISAPSSDADHTIVLGVNEKTYEPPKHDVVSNASCTTNCLAPVAKVLHDCFGIAYGSMTTVHSYTNDQRLLDLPHKDLRRARAAALSMIPTSTGAAKALHLVIPALKGKLDGYALRVPTPDVSVVDLTVTTELPVTLESVNAAFRQAADGSMKDILGYNEAELVSIDFRGDPRSSIYDAGYTRVLGTNCVKVLSWYDNEWAYACRCRDLIHYMADHK